MVMGGVDTGIYQISQGTLKGKDHLPTMGFFRGDVVELWGV